MSEQNPFAPVGTTGMIAQPGAGPVAPQGLAPPPPMQGFAPAPVQGYDHPGMTLTELSFAPMPTEAPPAPAEPPPPAAPALVGNVLPSGGVSRRLSMGGRTPLLALVLVLLLGGAGVYFGTGLFKSKDAAPAPVVRKPVAVVPSAAPSKSVVVAPAKPKPAAKPVVKPLVGKTLSVTKANSRTYGGAYTITVPTGWQSKLNLGRQRTANGDVAITHPAKKQLQIWSAPATFVKGPLTAAKLGILKANDLRDNPGSRALPGDIKTTVAGGAATGFDATLLVGKTPMKIRSVYFEHAGVVYGAALVSTAATFPASLQTFNQLLASVKFAN